MVETDHVPSDRERRCESSGICILLSIFYVVGNLIVALRTVQEAVVDHTACIRITARTETVEPKGCDHCEKQSKDRV